MIIIKPQIKADTQGIEHLLDEAFGPERLKKTVYRLRDGVPPVKDLCFVAYEGEALRASLRFWRIKITPKEDGADAISALLLGPLAVDPRFRGKNIGIDLMEYGLARAQALGHKAVVLVGDLDYYSRVGFSREAALGLSLPGPVDSDRLLARELEPGALSGANSGSGGLIGQWIDQEASESGSVKDGSRRSGGA